jgi:histidyl-tRNA synthetase
MSLETLGATIKFALNQETVLLEFFQSMQKNNKNEKLVEVIDKIVQLSTKNLKRLKRIRRENTTEMILEPIKGLEKSRFIFVKEDINKIGEHEVVNSLKNYLTKIILFYSESAEKVSFIGEISYVFEQFKEKYQELINLI